MKYVYIYHAWIPKCQVASSGNKLLALTHDTHQTSYIYNNYVCTQTNYRFTCYYFGYTENKSQVIHSHT